MRDLHIIDKGALLAGLLLLGACAGTRTNSPLSTGVGKVKTLRELGYRELGFPETGMQVGTLVLLDPDKPGAVAVMCGSKDSLTESKFESVEGPAEWAGARAVDMGVASTFLEQALGSASIKGSASDSVEMKNIKIDRLTLQQVYGAALQPGCANAIERFYASEDQRELGLVQEVIRADFEASSSLKAEAGGTLRNPAQLPHAGDSDDVHGAESAGTERQAAAEQPDSAVVIGAKLAPSSSARVLARDLVVGYKADISAAREIAIASGVRMDVNSPQLERILENETRPKYERLRKRMLKTGDQAGPEWDRLPFKRRMALAREYGQFVPLKVFDADRPTESAVTASNATEVKP